MGSGDIIITNEDFTEKELTLFERRYENQYDLTNDQRYNLWLATVHPDSAQGDLQYPQVHVQDLYRGNTNLHD